MNERQLVVLQCMFDAWLEDEMPLPGDMSYGEAMEIIRGFGIDPKAIEERLHKLAEILERYDS